VIVKVSPALALLSLWGPLTEFAGAQTDPPVFTASSVLPANARRAAALRPGMLVSIYGQHLGPAAGCTARASFNEPVELCASTVTVGGVKAGLLYVQDTQINLRVPLAVPTEGLVRFVVTHNGRRSRMVAVRFAPYGARIALAGEAYVRMPVWIEVTLPESLRRNFRYPMTIWPADFGGHDFEVRRNGVTLRRLTAGDRTPKGISCGGGAGAPGWIGACGLIGLPHEPRRPYRLPLHLLYRLDQPGVYEVRYQGYDFRLLTEKHVLARSPWLRIEVHDFPEARRIEWLAKMKRAAPSDPVELLNDFLPSLLAAPDRAVLPVLEDYLYHSNELVRQYSLYGLYHFEDNLIAGAIPGLIRRRGPTTDLAYLVSWRRDLFQPQATDLVRAVLPYVESPDPLLSAGALKTLMFLRENYDWRSHPEMHGLMDTAVLNSAGGLLARRNLNTLQQLAEYLGGVKTARSRKLLWRLVEDHTAREQALICLTWIADPRDLPKLGKYNNGTLDYSLKRAYGSAAAPYLRGGGR
jgi:hypothetical protein